MCMARKVITQSKNSNPGMMFVLSFLVMFAVNSLVLYVAQTLFPSSIVIGTHALSYYWGISMSMGKLALVGTFAMPFVREIEIRRGKMFESYEWMIVYFVLNFVTLWVITRFSEQFGLGVQSWMVVASLAFVMNIAQGIVMMTIQKMQEK